MGGGTRHCAADINALCAAELGCIAEFLAAADLLAFARCGRRAWPRLRAAPAWRRRRGELGALLGAADIVAARLLHEIYDFATEAPPVLNAVFIDACESGLARKAAFLAAHCAAAATGGYTRLLRAASAGHFNLVKWAAQHFGLGRRAAAAALGEACREGHGAVAAWLADATALTADATALTADDVRAGAPNVLARACEGGHLAVAMWLADRFGLGPDDVWGGGGALLRGACAAGRLAAAVWAAGRFGLAGADARACGGHALRSAAANGDLAVVCWLWRRFPSPRREVRTVAVAALHAATRRDRLAVTRWLVAEFGLDAAVAAGALPTRRRGGPPPPLTSAERWLVDRFAIKWPDQDTGA